jgi:hypothetical protein
MLPLRGRRNIFTESHREKLHDLHRAVASSILQRATERFEALIAYRLHKYAGNFIFWEPSVALCVFSATSVKKILRI